MKMDWMLNLTKLLPLSLRKAVLIRAWADATTGRWSHVEAPAVTVFQALDRMT